MSEGNGRQTEQAVLGSALRQNDLIPKIRAIVRSEDFRGYAHQVLFKTILDLYGRGKIADPVTLAEHLQAKIEDIGGYKYLAELWEAAPAPSNALAYAGLVREAAGYRQLERLGKELADWAHRHTAPLNELLADVENNLRALRPESQAKPMFPGPLLSSELRARDESRRWLWHGCVAPGAITLFSALWKSGKTTLLAHLLRAFESGGKFCGRNVQAANVLYVTEESESRWAERRQSLNLGDHASFIIRPFITKPDFSAWMGFILYLREMLAADPRDLIVFDTLSNLWPVRNENDAGEVQSALMPLQMLTAESGLLLSHHLKKGDGQEATGSRGSGALCAFVDTILELRRYKSKDRHDRNRVLTGYGRSDDTPVELVIELQADGLGYTAHGDRDALSAKENRRIILELLPEDPPGITRDEIVAKWPTDKAPAPTKPKLLAELTQGLDDGVWSREGAGVKNNPHTFWARPPS
jgi:hypothetical protein